MSSFIQHYKTSVRGSLEALFQWLLLAVCTGVVCGALGTAFYLAVEIVTGWRAQQFWLLWLLPVAGVVIVALYKLLGCQGMGTNDVLRAVQDGTAVTPWLVPAIFFGTVLTHLCGGSAGREGAALQMGGSIGWNPPALSSQPRSSVWQWRCAPLCLPWHVRWWQWCFARCCTFLSTGSRSCCLTSGSAPL